ncbi:MAG: AsmA-like C-terminal region-containing protein [Litoreibacter sp.]
MSEKRDIPPHLRDQREGSSERSVARASRGVGTAAAIRRCVYIVSDCVEVMFKLAVFVVIVAVVAMSAHSVSVPDRYLQQIEARVNTQIREAGGVQRIAVREASFGLLGEGYQPTIVLDDVQVFDKGNLELLRLPEIHSTFSLTGLLQGQAAVRSLDIKGAALSLERDRNGQLLLNLGTIRSSGEFGGLADMMRLIDELFAQPVLAELEYVRANDMVVTLDDLRTGREFKVEDGQFELRNADRAIQADLEMSLAAIQGAPATLHFTADKRKGSGGAQLSARFSSLSTRDLAAQVDVLNVLKVLDAPTSGHLTAAIDVDGELIDLRGTLDIGKGMLSPEGATPLAIDGARAQLSYELATERLSIEEISLSAPEGRFRGEGHVDLRNFEAMVPQTLLGQLRLSDIYLAPWDVFESPVIFESGAIDLRYRPLDQSVEIGQLVLSQGDTKVVAKGRVGVDAQGWRAALDAKITEIGAQDLLAMWPQGTKERTRDWLRTNILVGNLTDVSAAVRLAQTEKPRQAVTFNFVDSTVRYMRTLPPIQQGLGYGAITGNQFVLNLHSGVVTAPDGHEMDVGGSVIEIANMALKPSTLEVGLNVKGDVRGALSLLDEKPFEFLKKSGQGTDFATGRADLHATLRVPLIKQLKTADIGYDVSGVLLNVRSETLIKDRVLEAPELAVRVDGSDLSIGGRGTLDGINMDATWSRKIGKESGGAGSRVDGWVALSPRSLTTFGVALPSGMVRGSGRADVEILLPEGAAPQLTLNTDLRGIELEIAALGWAKSAATRGSLESVVRLGERPKVEVLQIEAAGLSTDVRIDMTPGGQFERAVFKPLRIAGRFNSEVQVISRGAGRQAQIVVNGGQLDIRKFGFSEGGGSSGGGAGPPIRLALDKLILSDGIALENLTADFRSNNGLRGLFKASVNGQAPVSGRLVPTSRGSAIEVTAEDGGAVMRGSGIFRNARGGAMKLQLQPTGNPGEFDGRVTVKNTRVVDAPSLASLLSALSVIGLLEQLDGEGIPFKDVEADFVLGKSGVTVKSSSAVGASMGITMEGVFDTNTRRLNMQGVISPIYAVNGLFGALFAPRKGEGLFGFTYTLKGSADGPQVGVNPLSMLTPGIFREIFRQQPPKL